MRVRSLHPERTRFGRGVAWAASAFALALACTGPAEEKADPGAIALVACADVARFGNGALCSADDAGLSVCGTRPRRTCASSWLCFDGPELAFCTCEKDADCAGRAEYINQGRLQRQVAPLGAVCKAGRCQGAP